MDVYVCFDVEDLVHPDSDDIAFDIAEMLAEDGVTASMFVVGEKARLWERRGRWDVIGAVARHDVGHHTDHHSVHPTVSEYLAELGWADGVAEAVRQEGGTATDLMRLFGQYPAAWGTSGSSWAPQIPAATRAIGIPANVYSHARSGDSGTCWYAGQLCYNDVLNISGGENTYADQVAFDAALPALLDAFSDAERAGKACVGLFGAHPTRLRYTVFWDVLNFKAGQNTPPAEYRSAPRRTDDAYATALRNLQRTVAAVRALRGIRMTSPRTLNGRFGAEGGPVAWSKLRRLAERLRDGPFTDDPLASPAQALDLLARAVWALGHAQELPAYLASRSVLGPVDVTQPLWVEAAAGQIPTRALLDACAALGRHIAQTWALPERLSVDSVVLDLGTLARGVASAFLAMEAGEPLPQVALSPGRVLPDGTEAFVQAAIHDRLPTWPPHRPDLRLDLLAELTGRQVWSLKPAAPAM